MLKERLIQALDDFGVENENYDDTNESLAEYLIEVMGELKDTESKWRINMNATGIVRRIDELGNINIPKEIRGQLGIRESTPMELFVEKDSLVFKKYVPEKSLVERIKDFESDFVDLKFEMDKGQADQIEDYIRGIKALLNT